MLRAFRRFWPAIRPWRFRRAFWQAAERLQVHGTDKTNYQVFLETLGAHSRVDMHALDRIVREFLRARLPAPLRSLRADSRRARDAGARAPARLPRRARDQPGVAARRGADAAARRRSADFAFDFISHSEVMTCCKPDPRYYRRAPGTAAGTRRGVPDDRQRSAQGSAGQGGGHQHVPDRHASARSADGRERHARRPARMDRQREGDIMASGPKLICVTGPDGAGKTTQIARIGEALSKRGKKKIVPMTIWDMLLDPSDAGPRGVQVASRAGHVPRDPAARWRACCSSPIASMPRSTSHSRASPT